MTSKKITAESEKVLKYLNPLYLFAHFFQFRELIKQLTVREIIGRYKGSVVGVGWSFIHPLIMLFVYSFVFSVVFKAKWGVLQQESRIDFALTLFIGLISFNIFSEVVNISPGLILSHVNYVKKVVFPLEILPLVKLLSSLINNCFSLIILLVAFWGVNGYVHGSVLLLFLAWLPLCLFTLACSYFLASIGVFLRDIESSIGIVTTMLIFLTPIFYPLDAIPKKYLIFLKLNPLAFFVEDARRVVLWGQMPDWPFWMGWMIFSFVLFLLGLIWFMKTKKAFVDVV